MSRPRRYHLKVTRARRALVTVLCFLLPDKAFRALDRIASAHIVRAWGKQRGHMIACPDCGTELNGWPDNGYIQDLDTGTHFMCCGCGTRSLWDFDAPVPLLRQTISSNGTFSGHPIPNTRETSR